MLSVSLLPVICTLMAAAAAQTPVQDPSVFRAETTARVIDVVVRDSKGKPVVGLGAHDFVLTENGVGQDIVDVAAVVPGRPLPSVSRPSNDPRPAVSSTNEGTAPGDPVVTTSSTTALVFERLSPESRVAARAAALSVLQAPARPDEFTGVFLLDLSLRTLQPFTTDRGRQRAAVERASGAATSYFEANRVGIAKENAPAAIGAEGGASGAAWIWHSGMQPNALDDVSNLVTTQFREITQTQQGYASLNALQALVTAFGVLPGRKTILYFSDGLPLANDAAQAKFQALIGYANRYNVSIYPVDAVGLRVHSQDVANGQLLREAALQDMASAGGDLAGGGGSMAGESVMRSGTTSQVFRRLANGTGGLVVENTNDLARGVSAIDADQHFYYLLTYTPKNTDMDGKWRAVTVSVPKQHVTVRARSGYLAVALPGKLALLAYEAPALAALDQRPAPTDLIVRTAALVFPEGSESQVVVLAATDANALRFARDTDADTYRADFTISARILDASGAVVRKSSQPYRLGGSLGDLDEARRGRILFFRQPVLGSGTYTLEVAVHDALASHSGVRRSSFVVPAATAQTLQVSSVVLVASAERAPADEVNRANPLYAGGTIVYPNLGEPLQKSRDSRLTFYVSMKTVRAAAPDLSAEILHEGAVVAQTTLTLPDGDVSRGIRHIAQLPIDSFSPGRYTLRLTVSEGSARETREAEFEITP